MFCITSAKFTYEINENDKVYNVQNAGTPFAKKCFKTRTKYKVISLTQ